MKKTLFILITAVVLPLVSHANDLPPCDDYLIEMIRQNKVSDLKIALEYDCDLNCVTQEGYSPLYLAAGLKGLDPEITRLLLIKDADPRFVTDENINTIHNPAFYAYLKDEKEFSDACEKIFHILLRSSDANLADQKDPFGLTPRQRNRRLIECAEGKLRMLGRHIPKKKRLKITF